MGRLAQVMFSLPLVPSLMFALPMLIANARMLISAEMLRTRLRCITPGP